MWGDFSESKNGLENTNGVLHQQGRVLLDRDWNDQTRLTNEWQDRAARDVIGSGVAAIPSHQPDALKVLAAKVEDGEVVLELHPGAGWVDGLAVKLPAEPPEETIKRIATYLGPPLQDPAGSVGDIVADLRDAVVLEVWREALNAFQVPDDLIEPALGGPDTTERVHTASRLRLYQMEKGDTCKTVAGKVKDDPAEMGRLRVTLLPSSEPPEECPVLEEGGYIGFEHYLYRIEIAQVNGSDAMFKWSQYNGGLVGRGDADLSGTDPKITITANDQAIKTSGLSKFYLEVVEYDEDQGFWRVTYGAEATLNGDDLEIDTTAEHHKEIGNIPGGKVFFRLWNGIFEVGDYPKVADPDDAEPLNDGIRLEFDDETTKYYRPGDFWTFSVRAGLDNSDPLIDDELPEGPEVHRVPLAVLTWDADQAITFDEKQIEDCRDIFRPLIDQTSCCSFAVGDGINTFGDFNSVEEALRHLPDEGGQICLLPGRHEANAVIEEKVNIKISGCGVHTRVTPRQGARTEPIFAVKDSQGIILENMDLASLEGTPIWLEGSDEGALKEIEVSYLRILAYENGIYLKNGLDVNIHHNKIRMLDKEGGGVAIFAKADECLIERNDISVVPAGTTPPEEEIPTDDLPPDPADPCAEPEDTYGNYLYLWGYAEYVWGLYFWDFPAPPVFLTQGGIQVASGSEQVSIRDNIIIGGAGNGITLGSGLEQLEIPEAPAALEPESAVEVELREEVMAGYVREDGVGRSGISIALWREGEMVDSFVSEEGGYYLTKLPEAGTYQVASNTPGIKVTDVEVEDAEEFGEFNNPVIEKEEEPDEPGLSELLAFIYEVSIHRNRIANMGLSGIGNPRVDLESFTGDTGLLRMSKYQTQSSVGLGLLGLTGALSGFVVGLTVTNNRIERCLRMLPPTTERVLRGFGGISLSLCSHVTIRENRINDNGENHLNPVCGIFLSFSSLVDISDNKISNNGALDLAEGEDMLPGIRGGIVLFMALFLDLLSLSKEGGEIADFGELFFALLKGHAARIQGNYIEQPLGRALTILAYGPLAIHGNQLHTGIAMPGASLLTGIREKNLSAWIDLLAGSVLIYNLGRKSKNEGKRTFGIGLPGGEILFNDNQTRLGLAIFNATSQLITSLDDVSFSGNQSEVLNRMLLFGNTYIKSLTVRASNNRLEE